MSRRLAAVLLLLLACAHAPPRATAFGKKMAIGEVVGDAEACALLKEALGEAFDLGAENPELHLHVDATMSQFDEPVLNLGATSPDQVRQRTYRHVLRMHATLRLIDDASGAPLAEGKYESIEKGPEQPRDARSADDLAILAARHIVRSFVEAHRF